MRLLTLQGDGGVGMTSQLLEDDISQHCYVILSHTWGEDCDEVTFEDMLGGSGQDKAGYDKIRFCAEQAARDGFQYFWVDTCCIKKSSDAELSEAINSMFRWYQGATKCYVYLPDVSRQLDIGLEPNSPPTWELAFRKSRWFTRGWTLQELLAPEFVEFFSRDKERLGDKQSLKQLLNDITGIPLDALQGCSLSKFPIDERMSWAAKRETKRKEDKAYSLLGIFNIYMPLIYGEGQENAFFRLKEEIEKRARAASQLRLIEGGSMRTHSTKEDEKLKDDLVTIVHRHHSGNITRAHIDRFIDSLKDRDVNLRRNQVGESFDGTFQWIFNDEIKRPWDSFMDWLKSDSALYWIVGKAGSGKSTLMKFLLTDPRTLEGLMAWRTGAITLSGFLWNSGHEMQRSLKGLLSSVTCQLLEHQNEVAMELLAAHPELCTKRSLSDWSTPELKRTLLHAIRRNEDIFICVFLDGLDEIGPEGDVHELISFVETLKDHINVKVCVSSRPERPFQISLATYPKLELQDLTSSDIRQYITKFLEPLKYLLEMNRYPDDAIPTLAKYIEGRASGVFLWVTLVLKTLRSGLTNGDDWSELLQRLELLPRTLQELYTQMWLRLNEDEPLYRKQAAFYFRFILDTVQLQSVFPILPAMALVSTQSTVTAILDSRSKVSAGELVRLCLKTCGQLQVRCAGLLELRTEEGDTLDLDNIKSDIAAKGGFLNGVLERLLNIEINFVHRTARDFLLDTREGQSILRCEETTLEDQALRYLRAVAAASVILRNIPAIDTYEPVIEAFLKRLYRLLPFMSRTEESYKGWERLLRNCQDLFDHNVLLAMSCTDFLGLAAVFGFHVFVQASLKKLDQSSGITATYVNYILSQASSWPRYDTGSRFYYESQDFQPSVIQHAIYRKNTLVDWLLAYGADPNARLGCSTLNLWEQTAFMRFLDVVQDQIKDRYKKDLDRKPVYQWMLSTIRRFLDSGANLGSLAHSFWYEGVEHRVPPVYNILSDYKLVLLLEMNAAYLIQETLDYIKCVEPSLDVSWHQASILSTPKIRRPAILGRCAMSEGRPVRYTNPVDLEVLSFRTVVTLPEEDSKALAKILEESYTGMEIEEINQQLEAMWRRGEELNFRQYMEQRGVLPSSSQKCSYPPTPSGEPPVKRITHMDTRFSDDINTWFRE
jgi:hypothetical protein